MTVSAEISLYPLRAEYGEGVRAFVDGLMERVDLQVDVGSMSTIIAGEYEAVMAAIQEECLPVFRAGAAVVVVKISNACPR